jgi:hypothetical protein
VPRGHASNPGRHDRKAAQLERVDHDSIVPASARGCDVFAFVNRPVELDAEDVSLGALELRANAEVGSEPGLVDGQRQSAAESATYPTAHTDNMRLWLQTYSSANGSPRRRSRTSSASNVSAVYRAVERGELPAVRLSETGAIRIPRSALDHTQK